MTAKRITMLAVAATVAVAAAVGPAVSLASAGQPPVKRAQQLAALTSKHHVMSAPSADASTVGAVLPWRPITGGDTVLPVLGHATSSDGAGWLRVLLPGRPNGHRGWIAERGTEPSTTTLHLVVRTASRRVLVYRSGRLVRTLRAIVGKRSTPTPHGRFFVEESVRMPSGSHGGPYALALSARSNVLQTFGGGPGQIALHGVRNLGGQLGTAISHGCVRLANRSITWLAARVGPGVPVTVTS